MASLLLKWSHKEIYERSRQPIDQENCGCLETEGELFDSRLHIKLLSVTNSHSVISSNLAWHEAGTRDAVLERSLVQRLSRRAQRQFIAKMLKVHFFF